ncbi:MAG: threonine--tRNA ligase [Planctomycetota bacterium]
MSISKINLTFPDNTLHEFDAGTTGFQVAESIGKRLAQDAVAVKINGTVQDLSRPINTDGLFAVITPKSRDGKLDADALYCMRHTAEHIMTEAICRLWPDTKLVYGPPVDDGFYGDIDLDTKISLDDFPKIEAEMAKIVAENRPMTRYDMSREDGFKKIEAEGNPYKLENAKSAKGDSLSFYVTGSNVGTDFEDLCMGPHVPSTGRIGAFKLTAVAGAYFRGDEKNKQLQRIYGTAFPTKKDMDEHFNRIEEAKKRDHRVIGKQMGLFTMSPLVGQGLILWMPKGGIIRTELQNLMQGQLTKRGYSPVFTPHIGHIDLYKMSGHFPYYKDSQYPTIKSEIDPNEEYLLKPMNCPHHCQIYAAEQRSYRDLPIRLAEFGTVYRYEQSGELNGMTRVRCLTQDDAHLFCTHDQVEAELVSTVELVTTIFKSLGLNDYHVEVSLRDPKSDKYVGDPANWTKAEDTLRRVAKEMNLPHTEVQGGAAFYGPKLDFMVKDCIGRNWQLGTVQLDYNLPERFKLEYIGQDNNRHRPVMIHRAPFGSFERFTGILIEHFAGAFPLWLSPVQVRVANISEASQTAAWHAVAALKAENIRVEADISPTGNIKQRVKDSEEGKVPYLLVIGDREAAAGTVAVRGRGRKDLGVMSLAEFVAKAKSEIFDRA